MKNENNIVKMQMDLTNVVSDVYNKVEGIIIKYGNVVGSIPFMPDYSTIVRNPPEYYRFYDECLRVGDEIVCVMMSLSLVINSFQDIKNTKLTRDLSNEFSLMTGFRKFLDDNLERLRGYKYDLVELKRQVTDRIKLLQSTSFSQ